MSSDSLFDSELLIWMLNYTLFSVVYLAGFSLLFWLGFDGAFTQLLFIFILPFYTFILLTAIDHSLSELRETLDEIDDNLNQMSGGE